MVYTICVKVRCQFMWNAIYSFVWLFILFKWGNLKNWSKYYPTYLFFLLGDFIYLYFLSDIYPMWKYTPQGIDKEIGLVNAHVSLSIMLIKYPATTAVYLSKFPDKGKMKKVLYITFWVLIYFVNELIDTKTHLISYYHGWSIYWSILFNFVMFTILRIHYRKPLAAWIFSVAVILFLWFKFDVPYKVFR